MKSKSAWLVGFSLLAVLSMIFFIAQPSEANSKPVLLTVATWMPERHETSALARWWADEVQKRSGGKVKFRFFYSGAIGKDKDQLDNLKYGTFDIGPILASYDPNKSPLWTIPYLPWVSSLNPWVRVMALTDVAALPEMKEELAKWDAMFLFPHYIGDIYYLWTVKKEVRRIEDIKGLKIRSVGEMAESLSIIGANPIAMPMPDVFDALSKGIVDGGCFATASAKGYRLHEICKFYIDLRLGMGGPVWVMKKSVFEKLPPDIQNVIKEVSADIAKHTYELENQFLKDAKELFKTQGVTFIEFPKADQEKYEQIGVQPVIEKWIKDKEAKGLNGTKVWKAFQDSAAKYQKMAP
jgi:TRAP-type transport system periplasmic protein